MVQWKTIPVKPETHERLTRYKMGRATYDDLINGLLDLVPLEDYMAHYVEQLKQEKETEVESLGDD